MTNDEAKQIFLDRGFVNGIFDEDKWIESIIVISRYLEDIKQMPSAEKTAEEPIKHFGSIECPNCGRLLMLEEPLRIKVENPEIKVDLISREEALSIIDEEKWEYIDYVTEDIGGNVDTHIRCYTENIRDRLSDLHTYSAEQTENPTKDIDSAIEYWKSVDEDNNMVKWLTELQEYRKVEREKAEQTYDWCKGCKEYDTDKHCCHRYSSFIRESLQDSINAVLEDIKAEIIDEQNNWIKGADAEWHECRRILQIIDNHISGKENE